MCAQPPIEMLPARRHRTCGQRTETRATAGRSRPAVQPGRWRRMTDRGPGHAVGAHASRQGGRRARWAVGTGGRARPRARTAARSQRHHATHGGERNPRGRLRPPSVPVVVVLRIWLASVADLAVGPDVYAKTRNIGVTAVTSPLRPWRPASRPGLGCRYTPPPPGLPLGSKRRRDPKRQERGVTTRSLLPSGSSRSHSRPASPPRRRRSRIPPRPHRYRRHSDE